MSKLKISINRSLGKTKGKITSYHREQGHKKYYRLVDFTRSLVGVVGKVLKIEKDPFRTGYIAVILYSNGCVSYLLAAEHLKKGNLIYNTLRNPEILNYKYKRSKIKLVSCQLGHILIGEKFYNLENLPSVGGAYIRSAGTFGFLRKKYNGVGVVQLPSGEYRNFSLACFCSRGRVSFRENKELVIGKAGIRRLKGWRPIVRGRAMNPVDHPHGGRTNGGITPKTPWGSLAKGIRTTKRKGIIFRKKKR